MDQIKTTSETAERNQITREIKESIDRMNALQLARLQGVVIGMQLMTEKAG